MNDSPELPWDLAKALARTSRLQLGPGETPHMSSRRAARGGRAPAWLDNKPACSVQTHQISNISLCVGHISFVQLQAFHMFVTCRTNCHEAVFWRVALVELDLRNWQPSGSLIRRAPRFGGDSLASVGADADLLFVLGCHWRRWGCDESYGAPALGLLANVLQRLLIGLWACD